MNPPGHGLGSSQSWILLMLVAAVVCTNAVVPAPGQPPVPWPLAFVAFVLWLGAAGSLAFLVPHRRGS